METKIHLKNWAKNRPRWEHTIEFHAHLKISPKSHPHIKNNSTFDVELQSPLDIFGLKKSQLTGEK